MTAGQSFESLNQRPLRRRPYRCGRSERFAPSLCHHRPRFLSFPNNAGRSWRHITAGFNRTYTVPLLVTGGEHQAIFTVAAAAPPPMWRVGARGADSMMFRSDDAGESFHAVERGAGGASRHDHALSPRAGRFGRFLWGLRRWHGDARPWQRCAHRRSVEIAEKLPPAYDLVDYSRSVDASTILTNCQHEAPIASSRSLRGEKPHSLSDRCSTNW